MALLGALQRRQALQMPEQGDLTRLKDFAGPVGMVAKATSMQLHSSAIRAKASGHGVL